MTDLRWLSFLFYLIVLLALVKPLGAYMALVFQGERSWLSRILAPVENFLLRMEGVDPSEEMNWKKYSIAILLFNLVGFIFLFSLLCFQQFLPLNPQSFKIHITRPGFQYRGQLRKQYELAELRGRIHPELPFPDAWFDRSEFSLRSNRDHCSPCFNPGFFAAQYRKTGQFLE